MLTASDLLCFQRYSVAVYLVRVFTAADLFSQLKLCSVESAERCRERSKCYSDFLNFVSINLMTHNLNVSTVLVGLDCIFNVLHYNILSDRK